MLLHSDLYNLLLQFNTSADISHVQKTRQFTLKTVRFSILFTEF